MVAVNTPADIQSECNQFFLAHKILAIDKSFVERKKQGAWLFGDFIGCWREQAS